MNFSITRKNSGVISWEDSQVAYICENYQNGETIKSLSDKFKTSPQAIRTLLRKNEIELKGNTQGYPRNSHFFKQIDTPQKAYWLGFLYADGSVSSRNNEVEISLKDLEHLQKFQKAIEATNHRIQKVEDNRFLKLAVFYHFAIKDKNLHDDLISFGCVPNKTYIDLNIPDLKEELISHFIRGYFDGDGSLHWLKGTQNYRVSFAGCKTLLEDIKKAIGKENLSVRREMNGDREKQVFALQIAGRYNVVNLLNYMYKDSTEEMRLDRKYDLYLQALNWGASSLNSQE